MGPAAQSRALEAVSDVKELLKLAHAAVSRVRREVNGEPYQVAERMSQFLQHLSQVSELLRHEVERQAREPNAQTAVPAGGQRATVAVLPDHAPR